MNRHASRGAHRGLGRMWKSLKKCVSSSRYFKFGMSKEKHIIDCLVAVTLNKDLSDESPLQYHQPTLGLA